MKHQYLALLSIILLSGCTQQVIDYLQEENITCMQICELLPHPTGEGFAWNITGTTPNCNCGYYFTTPEVNETQRQIIEPNQTDCSTLCTYLTYSAQDYNDCSEFSETNDAKAYIQDCQLIHGNCNVTLNNQESCIIQGVSEQIPTSNGSLIINGSSPVGYGIITYLTEPAGAQVYINETYMGNTPITVELPYYSLSSPEPYNLIIIKDGYCQYQGTQWVLGVNITSERTLVQLSQANDNFCVFTEPSGVSVSINGTYKGMTPISMNLEPGDYIIDLTKEGYVNQTGRPYHFSEANTFYSKLWEETIVNATIDISSNPAGAIVYVNGTEEGTTPIVLSKEPGTYEVTITKECYDNYTQVVSGKNVFLSATLVEQTKGIEIKNWAEALNKVELRISNYCNDLIQDDYYFIGDTITIPEWDNTNITLKGNLTNSYGEVKIGLNVTKLTNHTLLEDYYGINDYANTSPVSVKLIAWSTAPEEKVKLNISANGELINQDFYSIGDVIDLPEQNKTINVLDWSSELEKVKLVITEPQVISIAEGYYDIGARVKIE